MRVMVLGHRGMLGHVVARWLAERKHGVVTTDARYSGSPQDELISEVVRSGADWVVNCIAKIDSKSAAPDELCLANTLLPLHLKLVLAPNQRMIHASTDGVFSGSRGAYRSSDRPDPSDNYGLSKALAEGIAEMDRCYVVRTSIIGPNPERSTGLMSWLLNQRGCVNGFTNHFWNGITTLEWAKLCEELIGGKLRAESALFHTGCAERVAKHELLTRIAAVWNLGVEIRPTEAPFPCDRTLIADVQRSIIDAQLQELRQWLDSGV